MSFCICNISLSKFSNLVSRITEETYRSVQIAEHLMEEHDFAPEKIELHLDVSPFNLNNGTSKISEIAKANSSKKIISILKKNKLIK